MRPRLTTTTMMMRRATAAAAAAAAARATALPPRTAVAASAARALRGLSSSSASVADDNNGVGDGGLGRISGVPQEHLQRRVRIFRPARTAMQQGRGSKTQLWRAEFENLDGYGRWTNPLMGWTSTGDPLSQTLMTFSSKEAAVEYAERNGFRYVVYEPHQEHMHERKIAPFGRAMVHHWQHERVPEYASWNADAEEAEEEEEEGEAGEQRAAMAPSAGAVAAGARGTAARVQAMAGGEVPPAMAAPQQQSKDADAAETRAPQMERAARGSEGVSAAAAAAAPSSSGSSDGGGGGGRGRNKTTTTTGGGGGRKRSRASKKQQRTPSV